MQRAWVNALKSGKYRKAKGALTAIYSGGSRAHCCLGVACVVARGFSEELKKLLPIKNDWTGVEYAGEDTVLPFALETRLGVRGKNGELLKEFKSIAKRGTCKGEEFTVESLVDMNDDLGWTHKEIAAYIEANPKNVFICSRSRS